MRLWPERAAAAARAPRSLRRGFVTPEGVDLRLELGGAGARAAAFALDEAALLLILITATFAISRLDRVYSSGLLQVLWMLGAFLLRNGWFILFEMGSRAATPGKRVLGLRVVARDGGPLTGAAVVARNAMREVEVFLPLSFLIAQSAEGSANAFLAIFALLWSGIFLFFPLFNRDRLRIGDMLAGTWVVRADKRELGLDLVPASGDRSRRRFSDAALAIYGVYELQTLEALLRRDDEAGIAVVAGAIRRKARIPDDPDDRGFLEDYYAALCEQLERGLLVGQRRQSKTKGDAR